MSVITQALTPGGSVFTGALRRANDINMEILRKLQFPLEGMKPEEAKAKIKENLVQIEVAKKELRQLDIEQEEKQQKYDEIRRVAAEYPQEFMEWQSRVYNPAVNKIAMLENANKDLVKIIEGKYGKLF